MKLETYGCRWPKGSTQISIEMMMIKKGGRWESKGKIYGLGLFHHYKQLQIELWGEDEHHHRWSDLELQTILDNRLTVIMGARDCVAGTTRIFNPITGETPTIQELCDKGEAPWVMTLYGPMQAGVPFVKGKADLYEVVCENGNRFRATARHFVSTPEHIFVSVESLQIGQSLLSCDPILPQTTEEHDLSTHGRGVLNFWSTTRGSLSDCLSYLHSCGGRPPLVAGNDLGVVPSPNDVRECIHADFCLDDRDREQGHSHPYQLRGHPSSDHFLAQHGLGAIRCLPPLLPWTPVSFQCESALRYALCASPVWRGIRSCRDISRQPAHCKHEACSYLKAHETKVQAIRRVGRDYFYDLTVPVAHHYFAEGFIHHNTGKTHVALSRFALTDYFCFPDCTLILMSSTDSRGLELRVWGDLKDLFDKAKERHSWLPGNVVDAKHGLFTDALGPDATVRDMRKGIIGIPCLGTKGEWIGGLEKYFGIKQKRRRLLGDEAQFMRPPFLTALANLDKGEFKAVIVGNPIGQGDPLDKMAEPVEGWDSLGEITKTRSWKNKFGGVTLNLVGIDSPNFDPDTKNKYPYLIDEGDVERVVQRYGKDSMEYWSQIMGVRKAGLDAHRVLTRALCERNDAFKEVIWEGGERTMVYGCDAAFGGDRCIAGRIEFGRAVGGQTIVKVYQPRDIQIALGIGQTPEEQISAAIKDDIAALGIPSAHVYFDAGMRATLATEISKVVGTDVNAVNFQGNATSRPVSMEDFVYDEKTGARRLKQCDEHYSKFVTELWFSVRYAVLSRQIRELPQEVAEEFYMREWCKVKGDRYELESKADMKERVGYSPDMADWLSICLEGARRLGFVIERIGQGEIQKSEMDNWLEKELDTHRSFIKKAALNYKV